MRLRDLLLVLDDSPNREGLLNVAMDLARRHEAHVSGLCAAELLAPGNLGYALGAFPEGLAVPELVSRVEQETLALASKIETMFRDHLRVEGAKGDWQLARGVAAEAVSQRAHCADLVMFGQSNPDDRQYVASDNLIEGTLMTAGRPILIVPYAGAFPTVGQNVVLCWNGTREAARAVHDALPLIQPDAKVTVLAVQHRRQVSTSYEIPCADVAEHLDRHGLAVTVASTVTDATLSDSDAILDYACDCGADLLVAGGYGHSRARELILGGVTRELLRHMTLPVLLSH